MFEHLPHDWKQLLIYKRQKKKQFQLKGTLTNGNKNIVVCDKLPSTASWNRLINEEIKPFWPSTWLATKIIPCLLKTIYQVLRKTFWKRCFPTNKCFDLLDISHAKYICKYILRTTLPDRSIIRAKSLP